MFTTKDITNIFNEITISDKGIKLLQNLSNEHNKSLYLIKNHYTLLSNFLSVLATSEDEALHDIVIKYLEIPGFLHELLIGDAYKVSYDNNYPHIFNTKSQEIHNYILSNLDITKYDNQNTNSLVRILPEMYIHSPRIKAQALKLNTKECASARKRLGL